MVRRLIHRLREDQRGAAVLEVALVAPLLATMVIGIVDISNAYGRKLQLEQAAQRAIEKIMNTSADDTVEATLQKEAADQAGVPTSNVTVTYRLECNGVQTTATDCATGQTMAQWINVKVIDTYTPMFSTHFAGIGADGVYHLTGEAGLRIQ